MLMVEDQLKICYSEVPCECRPETCNHFDGKVLKTYNEKVYL